MDGNGRVETQALGVVLGVRIPIGIRKGKASKELHKLQVNARQGFDKISVKGVTMLGDYDSWSIPNLVKELNSTEARLDFVFGAAPELNEEDQAEQKRLQDRRLDLISATVKKLADK